MTRAMRAIRTEGPRRARRVAATLLGVLVLVLVLGLSGVGELRAQTAADASRWEVVCDTGCRMGQVVMSQGRIVSRVLVYQLSGTEIVEVSLPLGVSMLAPIYIQVDDEVRLNVRMATCRADGCLGVVTDTPAAIEAFRRGFDMQLWFTGFEDANEYFYPFDLRGFSAAYRAYSEGR